MEKARILQFSDMHLLGNSTAKFLGLNVDQTFKAVVQYAYQTTQFMPPNLVLLTGDLSQDYSLASYEMIAKACRVFSCPVIAILGNHDDPLIFKRVLSKSKIDILTKDFLLAEWHILLLNSHWEGQVAGRLNEEELSFLEKSLHDHLKTPTLIFLHHQILTVECQWVDSLRLANYEEFLAIIDRHQQVKGVISGHIHQENSSTRKNIDFLTTPATSWQFAPHTAAFKLDNIMPGYRWIEIDGSNWLSEVVRIPFNKNFVPDLNSLGY